jgi:RimJ/RimL family protein N-acetyltransferase
MPSRTSACSCWAGAPVPRNLASQAAIERLGARKDGVLRHHMRRRDGVVRDTVMYSMTAAEWPAARQILRERLAQR